MNRRGVALIEAIVALVILASVGVTTLGVLGSTLDAEARSGDREAEARRAERVLIATVLLTSVELDQRIGYRTVGRHVVWVDRPEPYLYRVGVAAERDPTRELIATLVFRGPIEATDGS